MSAGFLTSNAEWQALRAVDHLARDLYLALRRCMDFRTGIVGGPHKAISWQALREDCEVPGRPGVRCFRPTEQQLRRRVEQLEKCGLVRRISVGLTLQFRMLMAKTDSSVQKKAGGGARGEKKPKKASTGAGGSGLSTTRGLRKADTHPSPGKTTKPSSPPFAAREEEERVISDPGPPANAAMPVHDAEHAHRLSEQRGREACAAGDGPAGRLAEGEHCEGLHWSPVLAWPRRIPPHERAAVAHQLAVLPHAVRQRVLDEWDGAMDTGLINRPWRFFESLVEKARAPGWLPEHADRVAARRAQARTVELLVRQQRSAPPGTGATALGSLEVARMRQLVKRRGES
ncbi:hypothetical protein [Ralstonia mannitolilytica]|uniref:hypothetical protein n=1 Tax=Ralstonia mannitolilytica TaxID=105219 RepID=UPI0028F50EEA|nr:hypothetical protein [Ralstonia mannitolilytica]CAJ0740847.1 hypothetical protein R76696_03170 [Ralstonia mannitolilytica]